MVLISSTFYARIFHQYPLAKKSQSGAECFSFVIFWRQNTGKKCAHKMMMKWTAD